MPFSLRWPIPFLVKLPPTGEDFLLIESDIYKALVSVLAKSVPSGTSIGDPDATIFTVAGGLELLKLVSKERIELLY